VVILSWCRVPAGKIAVCGAKVRPDCVFPPQTAIFARKHLDPRRGTGLILVVGDCEVQSGASVREYEGLTNPPTNYASHLSGTESAAHWFDLRGGAQHP
jgi:hypothetical protein